MNPGYTLLALYYCVNCTVLRFIVVQFDAVMRATYIVSTMLI